MRIAVCGLIRSDNLGEKFISDSLSWIVADELKKHNREDLPIFIETDISARTDIISDYEKSIENKQRNFYGYKISGLPLDRFYNLLRKVAKKFKNKHIKNTIFRLRSLIWKYGSNFRKRHLTYYETKFKDADLILIDGAGLLEYSSNEYQEPLNLITEYAQKHGIPVVFNAIGRAGEFDPDDYRCQVLMKAFQRDCVKYVSARDSVEDVQECVGQRFHVKLLADAAMCSSDAYGIAKSGTNPKLIGIGLVRGTALQSYNVNFTPENWVDLFAGIALELQNRGFDFQFFTNGLRSDYRLGQQVLVKLGLGPEFLVDRPTDAKVLYQTISGYSGLITCRMHSSIAAFSMGIPSVILSWNKKVDKYMDIIGYPHRAITKEQFDPVYIVDMLEDALQTGISEEKLLHMKQKARESVTDYINLLIH